MDDEIEINVKLWWGQEIRKITIKKGETSVVIRLKNMGFVSLSDEKTQNIFAGIIKGLFGIKDEMSEVHLTVKRDGTEKYLTICEMENLEEIVRKTFIEE